MPAILNQIPLKIFLADDDEDDRDFFSEALNSVDPNCELVMVNNGEKAISFFRENNYVPDFVFLDINMPKKNGIECLKFIKSMHPGAKFHVVMLSTSSAISLVDMSYKHGASIYIQKPSRFNELVRYLKYCLIEMKTDGSKKNFVLNRHLGYLPR
jgi:DNA-binding NtrC family response regulator